MKRLLHQCLAIAGFCLLVASSGFAEDRDVPIKIEGLLDVKEYDRNDNPVKYQLLTEIEVDETLVQKSLKDYVDKFVVISGKLIVAENGKHKLRLIKIMDSKDAIAAKESSASDR